MEANLPTIPGQQYEKYSENYSQINDCQHDVSQLDKAFFAFRHELLISQKSYKIKQKHTFSTEKWGEKIMQKG